MTNIRPAPVVSWHEQRKSPSISPTAYVDPTAVLIGEVIVEEEVIICPGVILRADEGAPIIIGRGSNIQDGVIMHCLKGSSIVIGRNCSIAHGAIVHGPCRLGDNCFVGFRAVLLKAEIANDAFIGHQATVQGVKIEVGRQVPAAAVIINQEQADSLPLVGEEQEKFKEEVLRVNRELCYGYLEMV